jgi:hypothetical protein
LNRPPVRSLDRSFFNLSRVLEIEVSRMEKSKGSSTSVVGAAAKASRSAFVFFLRRGKEIEKSRHVIGVREVIVHRGIAWAMGRVLELDGLLECFN